MTNGKTRIARIRYNPEFSGYEAIVFVHELGDVFSYPSFIEAPLDAEYSWVMAKLTSKALNKHRSAQPGLRSQLRRLTPMPISSERPPLAA